MTDNDPIVSNPTWTGNIQGFFTAGEIACMQRMGIDLSSYDSVKQNAQAIYEQTSSGNMPQGGPRWSANRVQTFKNWMDTGYPEGAGGGAAAAQSGGAAAAQSGGGATGGDDPLVANPSWTGNPAQGGNIQQFFTPDEIGCMKQTGIVDLSSYESVKEKSTDIFEQTASGNMPAGDTPWSANKVQTFLNWINTGMPETPSGTAGQPSGGGGGSVTPRLRKNVNALSTDEVAALKTAFQGIMALNPGDKNSYFYLASIHGLPLGYCMHHVNTYNPWHRVYITKFEDALRSIPGCENVTLPYWDITETTVPALLSEAPFNSYTVTQNINDPNYQIPYTTQRSPDDQIIANLASFGVTSLVEQALGQPLFGQFQLPQGYSQPVMQAHDSGHVSCGVPPSPYPTMGDQDIAAYDPIFWFFHCNWERVFWSWQVNAGATTLAGFEATLAGDTDWLNLALDPWPDTTADVIPYTQVTYDQLAGGGDRVLKTQFGHVDAARAFTIPASAPVSVRVKDIDRMNIPGSFVVHLLADGETVAKQAFFQPKSPKDCTTCRKQSLVSIDFKLDQQKIAGRKLSVSIEGPSVGGDGTGAFPLSKAGNPTINARLLLEEAD